MAAATAMLNPIARILSSLIAFFAETEGNSESSLYECVRFRWFRSRAKPTYSRGNSGYRRFALDVAAPIADAAEALTPSAWGLLSWTGIVSRAVPLDFAAVASSLRRSAIALCRK